MQVPCDADGNNRIFGSMNDQDAAGGKMSQIDTRIGVQGLYLMKQATAPLRITFAAVFAKQFFDFGLGKEPLIVVGQIMPDVFEVSAPVGKGALALLLFNPEEDSRSQVG